MFLLAESKYPGCTRLADIMEDLSHDSVNRFLLRERYEPKDLFDEARRHINLVGGTLTGIAKNRSCSVDGKNFTQVQNLEIPETGLIVYLKKFGQVKVFRRSFKNETSRYYIIYIPDKDALLLIYPSSVTLRKHLPFLNSRAFIYQGFTRFFSNNKYNTHFFLIG